MIDDEALQQIEALPDSRRPLIVCDIDEVILHFVAPFMAYLAHNGYELRTQSYRLTGNVFSVETGIAADQATVTFLLGDFFANQHDWQHEIEGARDSLHALDDVFDVVLLTAMPHLHRARRLSFLRGLGLNQPLLTVESEKGPSVAKLAQFRPHVAFIDDLAHNHHSVAEHTPAAKLYQIMAFRDFEGALPKPPAHTQYHEDWQALGAAIRADLG
jgi:hypothetical protein